MAQMEQKTAGAAGDRFSVLAGRLRAHVDRVWVRAKAERATREAKWRENLLVADGQVVSIGAAGEGKGAAWRAGDERSDTERLRVARQKVCAAKVSLGDSLFRADRLPFSLGWTLGAAGTADELERIRRRVDEIATGSGIPQRMRDEIEEAASYGEGWVCGFAGMDAGGRPVAALEVPSVWEMYFDEAGAEDLSLAEYVIRQRLLSAYDVARMVNGAERIYRKEAVTRALQGAQVGPSKTGSAPKETQTRSRTERVAMRECWLNVPASVLAVDGAAGAGVPDTATLEWRNILVVLLEDEIVAVVEQPGPLPYYRAIWDTDRTRGLPQGLLDVLGPTQQLLTGMVRAWAANLRQSSRIVLAGKRERIRQDPEQIVDGVQFIDLDPDTRDVREAIQQLTVAPQDAGLVQGIEMLLQFADLESNIPRIQQGQQMAADATAFELRARLAASGKYLAEVVRKQDGVIRWVTGWVLYVMALAGEIPHEALVSVVPRGFSQFSDLVTRLDGLIQLLQLSANPKIDAMLNHERIVRQIVAANDLDASEVLLTAAEQQARAQAEAESGAARLAMDDARAEIALKQARATREQAAAAATQAGVQLDRARFIHEVEKGVAEPEQPAVPAGSER